MKFNKEKKFTAKYYVCNIMLVLMCITALTGCHDNSLQEESTTNITENEGTQVTIVTEEKQAVEKAKKRSLEIASLYKDKYAKAEKTASVYYDDRTVISQDDVDDIENLLIKKCYPVINSDITYPDYLENSDCVSEFWAAVSENKDGEQELIKILQTGELYYCHLQYFNGEKYQTGVVVSWNEKNEPVVSTDNYTEVLDWYLSENDDFYYQIYPLNMHWDAYTLIRLKPVDKKLYDLTLKYLSPIGYLNNNMFLCDWTSDHYGDLSFNDLLEYFYKVNNKDYFYAEDYESVREPYYYSFIPASLFEKTIMPYFDISLQEFRTRSLYDSEKDIYPWQEICCDNVTYYPTVNPEVVKYKENDDGTFTLTVNARCSDYKTDCLFTHEVVIRPLENERFHYLSNKITYKSDIELPPNYPRLPPQRINHLKNNSVQ